MSGFRHLSVVAAAIIAPAVCSAAKPDIEAGKTTFTNICGVCHSTEKSGGATVGPNLLGIVGRKAATEPDYKNYTQALKNSRITWNKKNLDKFLTDPTVKVPDTSMPMKIEDKKVREDVVAYLLTLKKP
jgi:cytochrome c